MILELNSTRVSTAATCGAANGGSQARLSYSTQPSEKISTAGVSWLAPVACSGAMYPRVPSTAPVPVTARDTAT